MVLTSLIGAGLGTALAFPTGLLFGQGYGLGVRQGYNSYKPSKNPQTNAQHTSINPLEGAFGAGQLSAQERFDSTKLGIQEDPSISMQANKLAQLPSRDLVENIDASQTITREQKNKMTRAEFKAWYNKNSYTSRRTSR